MDKFAINYETTTKEPKRLIGYVISNPAGAEIAGPYSFLQMAKDERTALQADYETTEAYDELGGTYAVGKLFVDGSITY